MKKNKILLIEDDLDLLTSLDIILKGAGYQVIKASDGDAGIKKAKKYLPNLILCDIMMPTKSGYDVLNELSNDKKCRTIPFIFLTAKVKREDIRHGMELGADDYLLKPFEVSDLLNSVKTRLAKYNAIFENNFSESSKEKEKEKEKRYNYDDKIAVNLSGKSILVEIKKIKKISVSDHYSILSMETGSPLLVRQSISNWESSLPEEKFVRVHRNTIVNINHVLSFEKNSNSTMKIFLKNESKPLMISRRYTTKMRRLFEFLS